MACEPGSPYSEWYGWLVRVSRALRTLADEVEAWPVGPAAWLCLTARQMDGTVLLITTFGEDDTMLMLRDDQKVSLSIQPVDAKGFPAVVDGVPTWNNSDEAVGTLVVAADGFSAVYSAGLPGLAQVSVSADADMGAGVRTISGALDIQVEPGEAMSLSITAGVPGAQ